MKKGLKILLITVGAIIGLLFGLWLARNVILTNAFEKIVPVETSGKVHLAIKSLDFSFVEQSISIDSLEINFTNTYLDKDKNTEFRKIVFAKVLLENFNVFALLFDKQLIANGLIFSRPDIFIVTNGKESENKTNPQDLLNLIENSSGENFGFLARLGKVELRYGQIDVVDINDPAVKFYTESLTIFLDDFNSIEPEKLKSGQVFFSKSVYLKVVDLYKSFHNGYAFTIDSLTWFSGKYNLDAHGFSYQPVVKQPDSVAKVSIMAKSLLMDNFHLTEAGTSNRASVRKIVLNDGDLHIRQGYIKKNDSNQPDTVINDELFQMISADTLIMNRNQLFISDKNEDTVIFFKNLNLRLEQLKLDSLFIDQPQNHFDYNKFQFSTDAFVSNKLIPGIHIQSESISYDSKWHKFILDEFKVIDNLKELFFQSGRVKFNFSLKKLLRNQHQRVDLFIIRPYAEISLEKLSGNGSGNQGILSSLEPGNVKMVRGTLKVITSDSSNIVGLNEFTFFTRKFRFNKDEQIFSYDSLYLNTKGFSFINKTRFTLSGKNLIFNGEDLRGMQLAFSETGSLQHYSLNAFSVANLQTEKLIFNNELKADGIVLAGPETTMVFDQKENTAGDSTFSLSALIDKIEQSNDFKVDVKRFRVEKGSLDLKWNRGGAASGIFTNYNLAWNNLRFGHVADKPVSNLKGLKIDLWNTCYFANGIRTDIGKLTLQSDNGYFGLEDIRISHNDSSLVDRLRINDVSVKFAGLRNFGFHDLFNDNKIIFDKLFINGLLVDMEQYPADDSASGSVSSEPYHFNLQEKLPFELLFDSVEIKNFHINYLSAAKHANTKYSIGDFRFNSSPLFRQNNQATSVAVLLKNSKIEIDSLQVKNDTSGFYLSINNSMLNPVVKSLLITGADMVLPDKQNGKTFISNDTLAISGITIHDSMPVSIGMSRIRLSKTNLKIFDHHQTDVETVTDTIPKMAGLYRLSGLLKQFVIDTVLLEEVNIDYRDTLSPKKSWKVNGLHFMVNGLAMTPGLAKDTMPFKFNNLLAEVKNRKFITGDSLYEISIERISYNSLKKSFLVDSLYVTPLFDTIPFFEKHYWQTDRINIFIPEVEFSDFDLERWNKKGIIHFIQIEVNRPQAYFYRDKSFPRDSLIRPLLQGMLFKVKQPFTIDSVFVNNAYLHYSEKDVKSENPGQVYFTDFNLKAVNISNRWNKDKRTLAKIFADGRLMGKAKVELNLYFPLIKTQTNQFWFTAKSEKVDLTTLNPMTQNLSGLTIMSGKGTLDIPLVTANDTLALGSMLFKYRNFKVSLYNRTKTKKTGGISSPLINFVVNNLVLRSNNPALFKRSRVGIVYFNRDRNKSIVNYVWKSTLSGVLSTMGFNNKEQRKRRKEYRKQEFDVQRNAVKEEKFGKE